MNWGGEAQGGCPKYFREPQHHLQREASLWVQLEQNLLKRGKKGGSWFCVFFFFLFLSGAQRLAAKAGHQDVQVARYRLRLPRQHLTHCAIGFGPGSCWDWPDTSKNGAPHTHPEDTRLLRPGWLKSEVIFSGNTPDMKSHLTFQRGPWNAQVSSASPASCSKCPFHLFSRLLHRMALVRGWRRRANEGHPNFAQIGRSPPKRHIPSSAAAFLLQPYDLTALERAV